MKHEVSRSAAATLAAVNEALRRAEDLHWTDPDFLEWERGQVGELRHGDEEAHGVRSVVADPGPTYGHDLVETVYTRPMVQLIAPHDPECECEEGGWLLLKAPFTRLASEYPPPEATVHGPLLLGPEPAQPEAAEIDPEHFRPVAEEVAW